MSRWLLTGGAGYIGSHVARDLLTSGREVVVLDDLSSGIRERVPGDAELVVASVPDTEAATCRLHMSPRLTWSSGSWWASHSMLGPELARASSRSWMLCPRSWDAM